MRRIVTYGGGPSQQVGDVLQSVFVAELLAPSRDLWLVSPWISDIPVLDNRGGQFAAVLPGASFRGLTLVDVLMAVAERGARLHIVTRDDPANRFVLDRLAIASQVGLDVDVRLRERIHDKGLLTDRIYLEGSMNFTYYGRERNEEGLTVNEDADAIARAHVDFAGRFSGPGADSN